MSRPIALPGRADAAGGDQHVRAGARAEVEHRLALVEIGDRGRHAAAERRLDGGLRGASASSVVQGGAEDLVAVLVGRGNVRAAARDASGRRNSRTAVFVATAVAAAA